MFSVLSLLIAMMIFRNVKKEEKHQLQLQGMAQSVIHGLKEQHCYPGAVCVYEPS